MNKKKFENSNPSKENKNLKRLVDVSVITKTGDVPEEMITTEIFVRGTLEELSASPQIFVLNYEELPLINKKNIPEIPVKVQITAEPEIPRVKIYREGEMKSELTLEPDKKIFGIYETPFGSMNLGVFSQQAEIQMNRFGGKIKASYAVDLNSNFIGNNDIEIFIKQVL